jgi:hypothetical protein
MNLHIITLNIPYPPDYGGMIDSFYRLRSLNSLGVRIHLHCFEYGRPRSAELESICETTRYYARKSGLLHQFSLTPYIVSTRESKILLDNLIKDNYPILFDGLHSTCYLNHPALKGRKKLVRLHNIEHRYYNSLSDNESLQYRKAYYLLESAKLKRYEKILEKADHVLPISDSDHEYFNTKYHNSVYTAPFHPFAELKSKAGKGEYILYHGDLSVKENSMVSDSLISNVFSKIPYQCVIAGKDPPESIMTHASCFSNIKVISNPDNDQMMNLIVNAQINLLPILSTNGFKLKLLMALYAGRHCMVNSLVEEYASIKNFCHIANSKEEMVNKIHLLMVKPYTEMMIRERQKILYEKFDPENNAKKIIELVFGKNSRDVI